MKISISLEVTTGKFETDMNRAAKITEKRMKEITASAKKFGRDLGIALAAGATGVALALKSAIDRADELKNTADKIGLTAEALSRLEFGAKQSGVEIEALQSAFVKMTKFQGEAIDKQSEAANVFKQFGIAVTDSAGNMRKGEDVFRDFAEVLSQLDPQLRNQIGLKIFGKSFADLVPLIQGGKAGLDEFAATSDRIGNTISQEVADAADHFNDSLDELKDTAQGITTQLAAGLLPQLQSLVESLQESAQSGEAVEKLESIFNVVAGAAKLVAGTVQFVVDTVQSLTSQIVAFGLAASGAFKLARLDFQGAKADAIAAKREMIAAVEAGAETRANLGLDLGLPGDRKPGGPVVAPHGSAGSHARGGSAKDKAFAESAAKRILDADNERRRVAAAAAAAKAGAEAESAARRGAAEAAREQRDAEKELAEQQKETADATEEFTRQLEDLQAKQEGPLAEASLEYTRQADQIRETFAKTKLPAEELEQALTLLADAHEKDAKAIADRANPAAAYLRDLQSEIDLLNAKTIAERDALEFKKQFPTATQEQADAAARMQAQLDETRQTIALNDEFRQSFADSFMAVVDGSKSAAEAFKDFASAIVESLLKIAAQKAAIALFGDPGTAGGGWLGSLMNFIPHHAAGTNNAPGGLSVVGEHGPELVNLPKGSQVIPNNQLHNALGRQVQININVDGATTKETAQQIATKVASAVAFAGRAN